MLFLWEQLLQVVFWLDLLLCLFGFPLLVLAYTNARICRLKLNDLELKLLDFNNKLDQIRSALPATGASEAHHPGEGRFFEKLGS
jgi:hypothetical protein